MIADYNQYYGSVFSQLIDSQIDPIRIRKLPVGVQGFYLIDEKLGLYIKFCRNRKGPWTFNFQRDHQRQYDAIVSQYGNCVTALVCGKDGIVALDHDQLREVLDENFDEQEAISVRRKLRHMYSVRGTNGELARKVAQDSLRLTVDSIIKVDIAIPVTVL